MINTFKNIIFCLITTIILVSCVDQLDKYSSQSDEEIYVSIINNNDDTVIDKANAMEKYHPHSHYLADTMLLKLHTFYKKKKFADAQLQADKFIKLYPNHINTSYAYYIKAMSYYDDMMDPGRDQEATINLIQTLNLLIRQYPSSEYYDSALAMRNYATDIVAAKEMEIGRYYQKKGLYSSALDRFQTVLQQYNNSILVPECLYRIAEINYNLRNNDVIQECYEKLNHSYPDNIWTTKAMKLTINHSK